MNFPRNELIDMIYILGEAEKNCLLAVRLYGAKYPNRRQPSRQSFQCLMERFDVSGSVEYKKRRVVNRSATNEEKEMEILLHVQDNPKVSSRELANTCDTSQSTVNRITRKYKYHPYHMELHQELRDHDFEQRVNFCNTINVAIEADPNFLSKIMFSDEATFRSNGAVNRHNMHYYSTANPLWVREVQNQNHWSLNVWCGIKNLRIIGPHFFRESLNGPRYLNFLQNQLPQLLEEVDDIEREQMWIQHDGAPAHYYREVREFLNNHYPQKWIGRDGFIAWPPRSCDLTPLDFFMWGYIKDRVYMSPPTTPEDMENRIRDACRTITPFILRNVGENLVKRLNMCVQVGGHIFEHLLRYN